MSDPILNAKIVKAIQDDKPKSITHNKNKIYISRKFINQNKGKTGGFIFDGIANLINSANRGNEAHERLQEEKRMHDHKIAYDNRIEKLLKEKLGSNLEYLPEYQKGNGFADSIKNFADKNGITTDAKKILSKVLKSLSNEIQVTADKNGEGLFLFRK